MLLTAAQWMREVDRATTCARCGDFLTTTTHVACLAMVGDTKTKDAPKKTSRWPPGRYFIGDPVLAVEPGMYTTKTTARGLVQTLVGPPLAIEKTTACGAYHDNYGATYIVRSGTLALVPWALCSRLTEREAGQFGRVVDYEHGVWWSAVDGEFLITSHGRADLAIDTSIID